MACRLYKTAFFSHQAWLSIIKDLVQQHLQLIRWNSWLNDLLWSPSAYGSWSISKAVCEPDQHENWPIEQKSSLQGCWEWLICDRPVCSKYTTIARCDGMKKKRNTGKSIKQQHLLYCNINQHRGCMWFQFPQWGAVRTPNTAEHLLRSYLPSERNIKAILRWISRKSNPPESSIHREWLLDMELTPHLEVFFSERKTGEKARLKSRNSTGQSAALPPWSRVSKAKVFHGQLADLRPIYIIAVSFSIVVRVMSWWMGAYPCGILNRVDTRCSGLSPYSIENEPSANPLKVTSWLHTERPFLSISIKEPNAIVRTMARAVVKSSAILSYFTPRLAGAVGLIALSSLNYGFDNQGIATSQAMTSYKKRFGTYDRKTHSYSIPTYWTSLLNSLNFIGFAAGAFVLSP